jgi:hypothetical protein
MNKTTEPNIPMLGIAIDRVGCLDHNSVAGVPCWDIFSSTSKTYKKAVCNKRLLRAGFNGPISRMALSRKYLNKEARSK